MLGHHNGLQADLKNPCEGSKSRVTNFSGNTILVLHIQCGLFWPTFPQIFRNPIARLFHTYHSPSCMGLIMANSIKWTYRLKLGLYFPKRKCHLPKALNFAWLLVSGILNNPMFQSNPITFTSEKKKKNTLKFRELGSMTVLNNLRAAQAA